MKMMSSVCYFITGPGRKSSQAFHKLCGKSKHVIDEPFHKIPRHLHCVSPVCGRSSFPLQNGWIAFFSDVILHQIQCPKLIELNQKKKKKKLTGETNTQKTCVYKYACSLRLKSERTERLWSRLITMGYAMHSGHQWIWLMQNNRRTTKKQAHGENETASP